VIAAVMVEEAPPVAIAAGLAVAERTSQGSASTSPTAVEQSLPPSAVGPSLQPHQLPVASTVDAGPASTELVTPPAALPTIRDRVSDALATALWNATPAPLPVTARCSRTTPSSVAGTVL
jgi:hypothetical protein